VKGFETVLPYLAVLPVVVGLTWGPWSGRREEVGERRGEGRERREEGGGRREEEGGKREEGGGRREEGGGRKEEGEREGGRQASEFHQQGLGLNGLSHIIMFSLYPLLQTS